MICSKLISISYRQKTLLITITLLNTLIALAVAGCSSQPLMLTTPNSLQIAMDNADQLRSLAKQRALLVKLANQQDTISRKDYQSAQSLYATARGSFDLWINQIQDDLKSGRSADNPDAYNTLVKNASTQSKNFINQIDQLFQVSSRGVETRNIEAFTTAGIELIQTIQKFDRQKRQQLTSELEALRWQAFDTF